jgi:cell division protein FtsA
MIVSSEPLRYKVDDKEVGEPNGAYGNRLSATYNFVLCDKKMRDRLSACLKSQGITVKEFVPNTTIAHLGIATTDEIQDGVVVINLGAQLTDVSVLVKGKVCHIASIPMGANDINNDITSLGIGKYVEDLKVGYGSALADRCDDDLIVFPQKYHIMVKSMLRRNLVIAIEARLVDIAGWVNREIKEAKCGSRFRPVVLLTGGGSRMRDIEELFKREIVCEDARVVYPEYGITPESMEHISTPANATVVSLLLFGAKRGSCSVLVKPQGPATTPVTPTPVATPKSVQNTTSGTIPPIKPVDVPSVTTSQVTTPAEDTPAEPANEDKEDKIIDAGDDVVKPKRGFGKKISKWFDKASSAISKSMSADDEQNF